MKPSAPTSVRATVLALALLLAALPVRVDAQGLRYTQTARVEMGGGMGALMSMAGGVDGLDAPEVTTVWVDATHTREDRDGSSTITDWGDGTITFLDHDARTFRRMPVDELTREAMEGARAQAEAIPDEARPSLGMRFHMDPTGRTETIAGYEAEQFVMVVQMDALMPPGGPMGAAGLTTAMVTELWVSESFPAWTLMAEARDAMADEWSPEAITQTLGMLGPELAEGLREQQEAMQSLRGTPLRVTTSMVQLTGDAELDVQAILDTEELDTGDGASAQELMQRRMRQLMGGGAGDAEPFIMMRTHMEVGGVERVDLDPARFEVPDGYREGSGMPGGR